MSQRERGLSRGGARLRRRATRHTPVEFAPGVYRLAVGGPGLRVNVYFVRSGRSWVLIDTGLKRSGHKIRRAADSLFGPASRPSAILLTHTHPDHAGSAARLARTWGCPVYLHPKELRMVGDDKATADYFRKHSFPLDRRLFLPLFGLAGRRHLRKIASRGGLRQFARPLGSDANSGPHQGAQARKDEIVAPAADENADRPASEDTGRPTTRYPVPGLPDWQAVATPGHTPGHVSFFREKDGVLLSGDAVVTKTDPLSTLVGKRADVCRSPGYFTWHQPLARESIALLAKLEPRMVAGGHGEPRRDEGLSEKLKSLARGD